MSKPKMIVNGMYIRPFGLEHRITQEPFALTARSYNGLVNLIGRTTEKAAEIRASRKYTVEGQRDELKAWANAEAGAILKDALARRAALIGRAQKLRNDLVSAPIDKSDLVGFFRRQEIRQHFQKLPAGRLNARIALGELTTDELLAIAEVSAEISGVSEKQRVQVLEKIILATNPETASEISDCDEAIGVLDGALRAATKTLKSDAGLGQADLDAMVGMPSRMDFIRNLLGDVDDEPNDAQKEDDASDDNKFDLGEDSK